MAATFNLTERPWIPVLFRDGTYREVSLLEAFERGDQIASIGGNPLEAAVLHRLLLAICHRVKTPPDWMEWLACWADKNGYFAKVRDYVEANRDKFDLYGEDRPFLQHPGLPTPTTSPAVLVYERSQGNNPVFIDGSTVSVPLPIPSGLAARALLVANTFGGSGTGGQNPINFNKKDTMYAGALCARMIALIEGQSLWETLLLNIVAGVKTGLPAWERELANVPSQSVPNGVCDLYTRPTRNIRLAPNEEFTQCIGVNVVMGEALVVEESSQVDPLVPLYLASDKKFKAKRVDADKALWRSADVLLAPFETEAAKPLKAISQLRNLDEADELTDRRNVRVRLLGVAANAQGPVTELWQDASIPFRMDLLRSGTGYAELSRAIAKAEEKADELRRRLYGFATRYLAGGGGSPDKKDVERLLAEIAPNQAAYWSRLAVMGETLAVRPLDPSQWEMHLTFAAQSAWTDAMNCLPLDARRLRAEFTTSSSAVSGTKNPREKSKV